MSKGFGILQRRIIELMEGEPSLNGMMVVSEIQERYPKKHRDNSIHRAVGRLRLAGVLEYGGTRNLVKKKLGKGKSFHLDKDNQKYKDYREKYPKKT